MKIFYLQLVKRLDAEDKDWRRHYWILLDNAPYHKSTAMLTMFEELDIPLLFTGPHSYSAVPIELWFAAFKAADINPRHLPMSKK